MPSPSSCIRCSRPLEVESASGLCLECLRTANSPGSTSKDLPFSSPAVNLFAPTVSAPPAPAAESASRTRTHEPQLEPATTTGPPAAEKVPLPPAPPGYELIRELGIGGMGAVYLAQEIAPERLVAIKFLQRPGHQGAFERFLVEVRALALLDHPNIIRVLSSDFLRSNPYFTTEYAAGGCLLKRLEADGPLDPQEAARLLATVARALHAAHTASVIHRDLKPSNIVLMADGLPKVSDFGLAKRLDRDDDLSTGTGPLGSPPYMAPEQTSRTEELDARTDVYGLGATLYHLVTGRRPFTGLMDEVVRQVKNDLPIPPRSVRREVPRELEAIILKCLEKNPARRYQTAAALAADLDRFLVGDKNIDAPLLTWPHRVGQRLRRNRKRIVVATAYLLVVSAAFLLGAIWLRPKPDTRSDPLLEMQDNLRNGRTAILVPEVGLPKWHRWVVSSPELGPSPTGDGTCSFESMGQSMLELCPDPMTERYLIRAEIQFVRTKVPNGLVDPGQIEGITTVGLYFGYSAVNGNDGAVAHTLFMIAFNDTPLRVDGGFQSRDSQVRFRRSGLFVGPTQPQISDRIEFRSSKFKLPAADRSVASYRNRIP